MRTLCKKYMNTRRATIAFILAHIESRPRITFMHATAKIIYLFPCRIQGENQIFGLKLGRIANVFQNLRV